MIASHLNATYMAGEPVVIVPTHTMQVTPNSNYYYGAAVRLGPQSSAPARSSFYDVHATSGPSAFGSAMRPQTTHTTTHFPSLALTPVQHLAPTGNEMAVDETAPLSPSSSNSTEQDDEESAAAILYALESGSLSPRNSPLQNAFHGTSRGMKQHRRLAASPLHGRRKRVASLSEVQSPTASFGASQPFGKESADDLEAATEEYASASPMNESPLAASAFASSSFGSRQTSWSLPSHSPLGYAGFAPYNSPSMSSLRAPHSGSGALSSPTSTPIPIPRAKPAFSPYHPSSPSSTPIISASPTHHHSHGSHKKSNKRQSRARLDNHQCPNCHTSDSPLWRNCLIKGKILHLCNSCGLRYKKHKYCPHCYKVYYDADTNVHDWAQCITCHNWTHRHCLDEAGIDASVPGTYKCLRCLGLLPDCD